MTGIICYKLRNTRIPGCPICGYPAFVAFDPITGLTNFEICSCCFFQSGYEYDTNHPDSYFLELRQVWIAESGGAWLGSTDDKPAYWDYKTQLAKAGLRTE